MNSIFGFHLPFVNSVHAISAYLHHLRTVKGPRGTILCSERGSWHNVARLNMHKPITTPTKTHHHTTLFASYHNTKPARHTSKYQTAQYYEHIKALYNMLKWCLCLKHAATV